MSGRVGGLVLAAVVIAGLCSWRVLHNGAPPTRRASPVVHAARRPAPRFSLYDQSGQLVKLERYLGRTQLVVLFLGSPSRLEDDPLLRQFAEHAPALVAQGLQPIVVTVATPAAVRAAERQRGALYPFPILTDIDTQQPAPTPAHAAWGRTNPQTRAAVPGLFRIDRAGQTAFAGQFPEPVADPERWLLDLAGGRGE